MWVAAAKMGRCQIPQRAETQRPTATPCVPLSLVQVAVDDAPEEDFLHDEERGYVEEERERRCAEPLADRLLQ